MADFSKTNRNRILRRSDRAHYDEETVYRIVDEALFCHVSFFEDGQPFIIPTIHARVDNTLIFHGSPANRMLKYIEKGGPVCITMTLVDGIVLGRSAFRHSMNVRSVVLFGRGRLVEDEQEKLDGVHAIVEHVVPGRWGDVRMPSSEEMKMTSMVTVSIENASAKIRDEPPLDKEEDLKLPVWAGVLPVRQEYLAPLSNGDVGEDISIPDYVVRYRRPQ